MSHPSCSWGLVPPDSELCNKAPKTLSFSTESLSDLLSGILLVLNLRSFVLHDQSPSWPGDPRAPSWGTPPLTPQYHIQMLKQVWWIMNSPSACLLELSQHPGKHLSPRPHLMFDSFTNLSTSAHFYKHRSPSLEHLGRGEISHLPSLVWWQLKARWSFGWNVCGVDHP